MYPGLLDRNMWLLVQEVPKPQIAWRLENISGNVSLCAWPVPFVFSSICYWLLLETKWYTRLTFRMIQYRCSYVLNWRQTKDLLRIWDSLLGGTQRSSLESFQNSPDTAKKRGLKLGVLLFLLTLKVFSSKLNRAKKILKADLENGGGSLFPCPT